MNVKPGDLAVIVKSKTGNAGLIVEVLRAAPYVRSILPENGYVYRDSFTPSWVVRSVGSPLIHEIYAPSQYAMVLDERLSPIQNPGDDVPDESAAWLPPVPFPEIA